MTTSTVGPGKDYATLQAWFDDRTGSGDDETAICYSGSDLGGGSFSSPGWTSATIQVAPGHQHNGQDVGTSGVAYYGAGGLALNDIAPVVHISGLRAESSLGVASSGLADLDCTIEKMLSVISAPQFAVLMDIEDYQAAGASTANILFQNNICYWKSSGSDFGYYWYVNGSPLLSAQTQVFNNTIVTSANPMDAAFTLQQEGGLGGAVFFFRLNNNIALNGSGACYVKDGFTGLTLDSGWNLSSDATADVGGTNGALKNKVATDVVVDVSTNLSLKVGSPALDAGSDLSGTGLSTDAIGTARPQGSAWDVGALEFIVAAAGRLRRSRIFRFWRN